jgi:NAD(P)-dependent dehydrogenase (short-subunit alcohol dehydrogenase family)
MSGKLEGKVAVVTGGNSGIGLATAKEFSREGARVVITGRDARTLAEAAREIGGEVLALRSDSSSLEDIDELFAAVGGKFGRVDVLFVNAGVGKFAAVEETDEELFDQIMDINFKGAYFTVKKALPLLADGASVILNTSVVAHVGLPNSSVYSASKAALLSLVRTLSADLVGRGIRVNAVSPGPVETPIFGRLGLAPEARDETLKGLREQVPLRRLGRPEEIARTVVFLASSDSSFLLGAEIIADGGVTGLKVPAGAAASQGTELRAEAA